MKVLGVKIDNITRKEALQKVAEFLLGERQNTIFTPNPEMIVRAQKDEYFKTVLNSGDLNLCDGFGLWLAARVESRKLKVQSPIERIAGVDFMLDICALAEKLGKSIYLLGSGSDGVVKKVAEKLLKKFPGLRIVGADGGPQITEVCHSEQSEESLSAEKGSFTSVQDDTVARINVTQPAILFVAFGMGKQEKWIYENLSKMPSVKIAMGVGGAFDFISGRTKRAPLLMRKVGLEWVYRLYKEPRRIGRIFNATVKFIWLIVGERY